MQTNNRTNALLKPVVLVGLALMLYTKINEGSLAYYINPRFYWVPYVGLALLAVFALTAVYELVFARQTISLDALTTQATLLPAHTHNHAWWVLVLAAVPVLFGLLLPSASLSSSALATRGVSAAPPARVSSSVERPNLNPKTKNILDWLRAFSSSTDPKKLVGQPADVVGFVHYDERAGKNNFWVTRYIVTCCIADGSGVGLVVKDTDKLGKFEEGEWVRVQGSLQTMQLDGDTVPIIQATQIDKTEQPAQPYLYP